MKVKLYRFITTAPYVGSLQFLSTGFKAKQSFKIMYAVGGEGNVIQCYKKPPHWIKTKRRQKWLRERYSLLFTLKNCPMITENCWGWMPTHETALRIKHFRIRHIYRPSFWTGYREQLWDWPKDPHFLVVHSTVLVRWRILTVLLFELWVHDAVVPRRFAAFANPCCFFLKE